MGGGKPMKKYFRRGYFPDDAESAYSRWRAAATLIAVPPGMGTDAFEEFVKTSWLAGWFGPPVVTIWTGCATPRVSVKSCVVRPGCEASPEWVAWPRVARPHQGGVRRWEY